MISRFLEFELDEDLFEMRREGRAVATQGRVFDLIAYLVRHRDRVVSKDELTRELWGASATSDTAISQVVKLARKALRDEGKSQRVIKTVRGRGFRFIADVHTSESAPKAEPAAPAVRSALPPPAAAPILRAASSPAGDRERDELVGREAELRRLLRALANLQRDRGGLILIEGEPGIGKTTLVEALAAHATRSGIDVHWGRPWEAGGASPFWPWIQVLRGVMQRDGDAALQSFMGPARAELVELLPELRPSDAPQASVEHHSHHARFRLFDAIARFLRNATSAGSNGRPRLIVLDDLHAFDEASIELLRFLALELDESGVLVTGTFRTLDTTNPALAHLADGIVEAQRIRLEGFTRNDVSALVGRRCAELPAPAVIDRLLEISDGNPLLLIETCRRLDPARPDTWPDSATLGAQTLPERIAGAVRRHMHGLPAATVDVLSSASALGREFSLPLLAAVCSCPEAEMVERLAPALMRGLLRPSSTSPDRLLFAHAQARNALYADLLPNRRIALHVTIAEQLESSHPNEHLPLYQIAHHYMLAVAAPGCRQKAIDYARRAAQRACDMRAYEVGAGFYDRALQLIETQGLDSAALHELLCATGDAWYAAGQLEHATARYDRAASLARSERDWERFARAVVSSTAAMRGSLLHDRQRQQQVREALSMLPATDSILRANLLAASAIGVRTEPTLARNDATTRAAIEMARRLGDQTTLLRTLTAHHFDMWGIAHPKELLEIANEMVELGRATHHHEWLLDALLCRIQDHSELGDNAAVFRDLETYMAEAEHFGSPWHGHMLLLFHTTEAAIAGDFTRATDLSERALRQGQRARDPLSQAFHAVRMLFMTLLRDAGDASEEARTWLAEPPSYVPEDYHPFWALPAAVSGRHAEAGYLISKLILQDRRHLVLGPLRRPLFAIAGQTCALLGDKQNAEHFYRLLLPNAGLHLPLQAGSYLGPVNFFLGTMAACLGRREQAVAHFEQALSECEHLPTWGSRTQYALAVELGPNAAARRRQLLQSAEATATQLGMTDLRDAARQKLAQRERSAPRDAD